MKSYPGSVAIVIAALSSTVANSQEHPFTVKDDIAMVRFSDPLPSPAEPGSEVVKPSPDGRHFALVTTKGLLAFNQIESSISIFDQEEVSRFIRDVHRIAPVPRVIARIISFPHREEPTAYAPVITAMRWSQDSKRVYFKGESLTGAYRLYVAKIDASGFRALTPESESVDRFDIAKNLIVYTASRPETARVSSVDSINRDAQAITGRSLVDVLFAGQLKTIAPETFHLSVMRRMGIKWVSRELPKYEVTEIPYVSFLFPFALSPKGNQLILSTPVSKIPEAWNLYEPAPGSERNRFQPNDPRSTNERVLLRPQAYSLIDLATGASVHLIAAPNASVLGYLDNDRAAWAADGNRILVTNTFLPVTQGKDSPQYREPCAVAAVDLPSLETKCLLFEDATPVPDRVAVEDVSFGTNRNEVVVTVKQGIKIHMIERYQLHGESWLRTSSEAVRETTPFDRELDGPDEVHGIGIRLSVRQSLNDIPTVWASDVETGKSRQLWDPNPQLHDVPFGRASLYHWKDKTGYEWSGILVKPVDYVPGQKYPLVIQLYNFHDGEFLTDGLYPTAFAARHLASVGFVVLQIRKKPSVLSEADPQDHLNAYRSAVGNLADAGLIDRTRVGVVGFSWTCWYVVNALIKEPNLFAAATIADGLDNSYVQYMLFAVGSLSLQEQMDKIRGARPLGEGLKRWVEDAPEFHLDQVQVPVRIEAINPTSVLSGWELYSSLRMQHKPVDFIYFPHGTHIHQKPLERQESQQGNIDWLRFWLQGYRDPEPSKRAEYGRWQELKDELPKTPATAATD